MALGEFDFMLTKRFGFSMLYPITPKNLNASRIPMQLIEVKEGQVVRIEIKIPDRYEKMWVKTTKYHNLSQLWYFVCEKFLEC